MKYFKGKKPDISMYEDISCLTYLDTPKEVLELILRNLEYQIRGGTSSESNYNPKFWSLTRKDDEKYPCTCENIKGDYVCNRCERIEYAQITEDRLIRLWKLYDYFENCLKNILV